MAQYVIALDDGTCANEEPLSCQCRDDMEARETAIKSLLEAAVDRLPNGDVLRISTSVGDCDRPRIFTATLTFEAAWTDGRSAAP